MRTWSRRTWVHRTGAALAGGSGLLLARPVAAHPYHVSVAQAHHRREQGTLEVSLRVRPEDLQAALRAGDQKNARVDSTDKDTLGRWCSAYVRNRFIVCDRAPKRLPLAFLGHELDARWLWMHFTFAVGAPKDLRGYHLDNRIFYEIAPSQTNTVILHHGGVQQSLSFRQGVPAGPLAPPA